MQNTMQAVEISQAGPPEVLRVCTRPVPKPKEGEVLLRVAAAGVNRPDCLQRAGGYPPPPDVSDLPGLEVAGTVVAAAPGVSALAVGDRVCALVAGGGYAEYCVAPAVQCLPVPAGLSLTIKDNGKSFQVDRVVTGKGSQRLGLLGMRERVEMVGGRFSIESAPGQGTTVRVELPHPQGKPAA